MAERRDLSLALRDGGEPAEAPPRGILEEDALDGVVRAVLQHLRPRRLEQSHGRILL